MSKMVQFWGNGHISNWSMRQEMKGTHDLGIKELRKTCALSLGFLSESEIGSQEEGM